MCLSVMCEDFLHLRVKFHTVLDAGLFHDFPAAERLDGSLKELVCLETYDKLVFLIDVSSSMRCDCGDCLCVD